MMINHLKQLPGSLSLPEAQGCPLVQYLPVRKRHSHVIFLENMKLLKKKKKKALEINDASFF